MSPPAAKKIAAEKKPKAAKTPAPKSGVAATAPTPKPGKAKEAASSSSGDRLVILDGHGIIFRAYFALREVQPFSVKKTGEETTAVYGFVNTLLRVVRELKPTHIAIAMDTAAPTFRHDADADYKAHREPIPRSPPGPDRALPPGHPGLRHSAL